MSRALITGDSITYDLDRKRNYAVTTTLTGLVIGGSIALTSGGSFVQRLAVTALITAIVGGSSYWILCRLVAGVTGGSGYYQIAYPTQGDATNIRGESGDGDRETGGESTLVDAR